MIPFPTNFFRVTKLDWAVIIIVFLLAALGLADVIHLVVHMIPHIHISWR